MEPARRGTVTAAHAMAAKLGVRPKLLAMTVAVDMIERLRSALVPFRSEFALAAKVQILPLVAEFNV
jgi:hypothetical protein